MGLFGNILKKKEPACTDVPERANAPYDDKLDRAYERCPKGIYPGGKAQVDRVIRSLGQIYGVDPVTCDMDEITDILSSYMGIYIRRMLGNGNSSIWTYLRVEHPKLIRDEQTAKRALAYVTINMKNNKFDLKSKPSMEALEYMVVGIDDGERMIRENAEAEKRNLDDPEYGLVPNKPIYTRGPTRSYAYVGSLKGPNGEPLTWKRTGSMHQAGINGMVDKYKTFFSSGEPYKTIYVNMYGTADSDRIPDGFTR